MILYGIGNTMNIKSGVTNKKQNGWNTARVEHKPLEGFCPVCRKSIQLDQKFGVGDLVLCWKCGDLLEVKSVSPLTLVRVFEDPNNESNLVQQESVTLTQIDPCFLN